MGKNIVNTLNKDQVKALFDKEAVLLGAENMVPDFRAVSLFGQEAIDHAHRMNAGHPGYYANGYGVGDYTLTALTFHGFQAAASFFNAQLLKKETEK